MTIESNQTKMFRAWHECRSSLMNEFGLCGRDFWDAMLELFNPEENTLDYIILSFEDLYSEFDGTPVSECIGISKVDETYYLYRPFEELEVDTEQLEKMLDIAMLHYASFFPENRERINQLIRTKLK